MAVFPVSVAGSPATSSTNTDPSSGDNKQPSIDSNVVFPLPEGPMTKKEFHVEYQ